ncbi:MAG: hypothetical protein E7812_10880 [Phenylobacterium sp.]|nr:MAG: hypothetical protein E7812_10880 [Phenylobacterium sp.]
MSMFATPLQFAAASTAIVWPLAAGATLVLWTRARAAERQRRLARIDGGLQGLFRTVEAQPLPERLELVVDALEEHAAMTPKFAPPLGATRKPAPTT